MANFNILKAAIDAVIKANGQQEITGPILNAVLKAMVDSLGAGFELAGVATPSTNPGTPDQDVYWLAYQGGTYSNFGGAVLPTGISMLKWDGSWTSQTFFTVDDQLTPNSNNLAKSGAVFDAVMRSGAFDLTAYNGGVKYADLSAALTDLNSLPAAYKRGGMSIKFVSSVDNKYVQYMYNGTAVTGDPNPFLDTNNWERVNLQDEVILLNNEVFKKVINSEIVANGYIDSSSGNFTLTPNSDSYQTAFYSVEEGQQLTISANSTAGAAYFAFYASGSNTAIDGKHNYTKVGDTETTVPENATRIGITFKFNNIGSINDITLSLVVHEGSLNQKITTLNNRVFGEEITEEITAEETKNGYIDASSGYFVTREDDSYQTAFYQVEEGQQLTISANSTAGGAFFAFYASGSNTAIDGKHNYTKVGDTETTVPLGSSYVGITFKFNNVGSLSNITLYGKRISDCLQEEVTKLQNNIADNWSDKTWLLIGDSLTEENIRASFHYFNYVSQKTGINYINRGFSGRGYADGDWFYNAISNTDPSLYDLVTIFGSGNDIRFEYIKVNSSTMFQNATTWEEALGDIDDVGTETLCGLFNRAFNKFYEVAPLKKFGVVTPTKWKNGSYDISQLTDEETYRRMDDYSNALVAICKKRGIPCLDLFHTSGLQPTIEAFRIEYYNENGVQDPGVHPNSKGHKWISNMFYIFLKQYLIM